MNEETNKILDIEKRTQTTINSYLKKEDFLKMIETLNFTHIESADIEVITGFIYNDEDKTIKRVGFKIEIE